MPRKLKMTPASGWLGLSLLGCAALALGCSSNKNHDERALVAAEPDGCIRCIDTCREPRESALPDCEAAEEGLEFLPIWNFDLGRGRNMYDYDDGSTPFRAPRGWEPLTGSAGLLDRTYEPEASALGPCRDGYAIHMYGGPFRGWGGGVGISVKWRQAEWCNNNPDPPDVCPDPDAEFSRFILDLSEWEGVSLWAKRGPDSQASVRVMVADKYVDDDLAYLSLYNATPEEDFPELEDFPEELIPDNVGEWIKKTEKRDPERQDDTSATPWAPEYPTPQYCQRNSECGCRNHKPCSPYQASPQAEVKYYCWDPEVDPIPGSPSLECDEWTVEYPLCGPSICNRGQPAWEFLYDPQFNGKPCTPYSFPSSYGGSYCFDPETDPPPVENAHLCGDYWFKPVFLTEDWELYLVPFTDMHQQGWAMESHRFDPSALTVVRLTWDKGWIDYWIDDVSFYRRVER
jgi:hypothetical protein